MVTPARSTPDRRPGEPAETGPRAKPGWTRSQPWISLVARAGLGAMWLYYAVPKLSYSSDALGLAVRQYQILPAGAADTF
ncbi:MAG TPA: hypothetical protein VH372_16560, partial [Actinospica sp.]|nr:hypothetical protein [Actinospica sp.]